MGASPTHNSRARSADPCGRPEAVSQVRHIEFAQYDVTNVHPVAGLFVATMGALAFVPRPAAATLSMLAVCVFMPMDQRLVVGGLDFSMLRLIELVIVMRILIRGENRGLELDRVDRLVLFWVLSASFFYVVRVGPSGFVTTLGYSFDALVSYFAMRMLVRTPGEAVSVWTQLAWLTIVLSLFMFYENVTRHNVFGMFSYDGVDVAPVRNGRVRAKGPFSHPILTGTFGAVAIPVFIGICLGQRGKRWLMVTACVSAMIIILACGSSGPLISLATAIFGWGLWRYRRHMKQFLWSGVGILVVLHFIRDKPVWHLILRVSTIIGGTGEQRYRLIDAFIRRFSEWALVGTDSTASWGWGLQDTTNHYVAQGVNGGLVTFILFILILRAAFVQLKHARVGFERFKGPRSPGALFAWGCSVSLAVHCVSFVSVSYFGQMLQLFLFFVASVPAVDGFRRPRLARTKARSRRASRPDEPRPRPVLGAPQEGRPHGAR